jgi:hypothetical protein
MQISTEGKLDLLVGLLALGGAGAVMIWPDHTAIGWAMIAVALVGGIALGYYHFRDYLRRSPRAMPVLLMILGAILFFAGAIWLGLNNEQAIEGKVETSPISTSPLTSPSEPHPLVFEAQFSEIKDLEKWLRQDENGLRELFDIRSILFKNIHVQNIRVGLIHDGQYTNFKYNNYAEGDHSFIWRAREGKFHVTPSGPHDDSGPRDVAYLITTTKYQEAQKKMESFINSALIPKKIKDSLSELKTVVNKDMELMADALNTRLNQDEKYFLLSEDYNSPYYAVINNDYFSSFISLSHSASQVLSAISEYWKTQ